MKAVAILKWLFAFLGVIYMAKGTWLLYGEQLMDMHLLATRVQLIAVGWGLLAVGCGIIEAIGRRSVGQADATSKAHENESSRN